MRFRNRYSDTITLSLDYVLQRALSVVEDDQKQALINIVKPYLASIQKYSNHGRHIIAGACGIYSVCHPSAKPRLVFCSRTASEKMLSLYGECRAKPG